MIEKILERLEALEEHCLEMYDWHGQTIAIEARNIVQEVAKEYGNGVHCIGCSDCRHKECENHGKV